MIFSQFRRAGDWDDWGATSAPVVELNLH